MPDSRPDRDPQREAFERGRRQAHVDGELESHEKRLNAINGSIERHAREAGEVRKAISDLRDEVKAVAAALKARGEVEASRAAQIRRANEQQISNRTFWLGVAAIITTIIAALVASHGGAI